MEEVYEVFKHVCKLCTRSFPCGRFLGAHMRSHMINCASSASDHDRDQLVVEKDKLKFLKRKNNNDDHIGGYGLRENHKKTWRLVESSDDQGMILDALLSCKESVIDQLEQEEVALSLIMLLMDVGQWGGRSSTHNNTAAGSNTLFLDPEKRSIVGKGKSRAFSSEVEYTKMIMPSAAKAMKCESMDSEFFYYEGSEKFELSASGYLSNESKINKLEGLDHGYARYDQENGQKLKFGDGIEVQLSKGLRNNNVLFRGELDATKSDEWKRKISEICNESDRLHLSKSASGSKRSQFEFGTCSKVFHSYQALGGHSASHKKIKGCSSTSLKHEIIGDSIETEPRGDESLDGSKQDQAMTINQQSVVIQIPTPEIREFMDLNLSAPVEEEPTTVYDKFKSWWSEPLLI
ncbi:hypothetical protein Droror1_Dr00026662 [Drosera rotundifolia]